MESCGSWRKMFRFFRSYSYEALSDLRVFCVDFVLVVQDTLCNFGSAENMVEQCLHWTKSQLGYLMYKYDRNSR